jgi:hypothetical protein
MVPNSVKSLNIFAKALNVPVLIFSLYDENKMCTMGAIIAVQA